MKARQARKIVRIVLATPINRMSDTWFYRAISCRDNAQIKKAMRIYANGVAEGLKKPILDDDKLFF